MFEILIEGDGLGSHVAIYWRGLPQGEVSESFSFLALHNLSRPLDISLGNP